MVRQSVHVMLRIATHPWQQQVHTDAVHKYFELTVDATDSIRTFLLACWSYLCGYMALMYRSMAMHTRMTALCWDRAPRNRASACVWSVIYVKSFAWCSWAVHKQQHACQ